MKSEIGQFLNLKVSALFSANLDDLIGVVSSIDSMCQSYETLKLQYALFYIGMTALFDLKHSSNDYEKIKLYKRIKIKTIISLINILTKRNDYEHFPGRIFNALFNFLCIDTSNNQDLLFEHKRLIATLASVITPKVILETLVCYLTSNDCNDENFVAKQCALDIINSLQLKQDSIAKKRIDDSIESIIKLSGRHNSDDAKRSYVNSNIKQIRLAMRNDFAPKPSDCLKFFN